MKTENKHSQDPTSLLISIRRRHRHAETQQLKNTIRFNTQMEVLLEEAEQELIEMPPHVPLEVLEEYIQNKDFEQVFSIITSSISFVKEVIDRHMLVILEELFLRLATPSAVIALSRLFNNSEMAVNVMFQINKFSELTAQLRRLTKGAKGQNIYLSCICQALDKHQFVDQSQLESLYGTVEELFNHWLRVGFEHNLTILTTTRLMQFASPKMGFTNQFVIDFLEYFWQAKNPINRTNILLAAVKISTQPPYNRSITILINIIRILFHGRQLVQEEAVKSLLPTFAILTNIFNFFNKEVIVELNGYLKVDGKAIAISLHTFLLTYEAYTFNNPCLDLHYLTFLRQFCKKAPVELICEVWSNSGLLEKLISELPGLASDLCFIALDVCMWLLRVQGQSSAAQVGQLMIRFLIRKEIQGLLENGCGGAIRDLCLSILERLGFP